MQLRWYQKEAVSKTIASLSKYEEIDYGVIIAMPTGTGKSVVIAETIKRILDDNPEYSIIMATHSKELVKQNSNTLRKLYHHFDVGIYCAGLQSKETDKQVTFGTINSMVLSDNFRADVLLIDEMHRFSNLSKGIYPKFFNKLKHFNPNLKVVGYTATAYRSDIGSMENSDYFDEIIYDLCNHDSIQNLIKENYLCDLVSKLPKNKYNLNGIGVRNGDFIYGDLDGRINQSTKNKIIVKEIVELGKDRKCWLVFTVSINHADTLANLLIDKGISASSIHSMKSKTENDISIKGFLDGKIKCLVNRDMLTTGFDNPKVDLIVMLRPTYSTSLHIQMLGRGTRPYEGKENCLVLDYGSNFLRLGAFNDPVFIKDKNKHNKKEKYDNNISFFSNQKACPSCDLLQSIRKTQCVCGFIFSAITNESEKNIDALDRSKAGWHLVLGVRFVRKGKKIVVTFTIKNSKITPSLDIDYTNRTRFCMGRAKRLWRLFSKRRANNAIQAINILNGFYDVSKSNFQVKIKIAKYNGTYQYKICGFYKRGEYYDGSALLKNKTF